ncbi:MAG: DUF1993 domain-containing protein [Sphingobium sp.]
MAFSLYDVTVPGYIQMLNATRGLIGKAEAFCAEKNMPEADLLNARLAEDMLPLSWQIKWVSTHSIGAIEGVRQGAFSPDRSPPAETLAAFRTQIDASLAALEAVTPDELESYIGKDVLFTAGELRMDFTAENFLLSFSQPNLYFHAATAYDILRHLGLQIGKRDFMGRPRIKMPA